MVNKRLILGSKATVASFISLLPLAKNVDDAGVTPVCTAVGYEIMESAFVPEGRLMLRDKDGKWSVIYMDQPYSALLHQARQFAAEHNLKPETAWCSPEFRIALMTEWKGSYEGQLPMNSDLTRVMIQGVYIEEARLLKDRFFLECQDTYYVVVPDGPETWTVDNMERWKGFKAES